MADFYNGEIESIICNAINIIVQQQIANANYDKLISGIVISENLKGTSSYVSSKYLQNSKKTHPEDVYRIEYQNSTFLAYPLNTQDTYSPGDRVLILIPNNDMSNEKYIIRKRPLEV